jgi:hypothetical protein
MLKASVSKKYVLSLNQPYLMNFAIAYYDHHNEQWISEGWKTLIATAPGAKIDIVLLNQPLHYQKYYYFNLQIERRGVPIRTGNTSHHLHLHCKESYPSSPERFWLENGHFKKYNAIYSGGEFNRFMKNIFNYEKWAGGWQRIDTRGNSEYTINFELIQDIQTHYHIH